MARIEFYQRGKNKHQAVVDNDQPPPVGALISIRGETWKVVRVTWCVDHADGSAMGDRPSLRANVDMEPTR